MNKIIAIGGGDFAQKETLPIDEEIVKMTAKSKPKALFIPTASGDDLDKCKKFKQFYGKELGCEVEQLLLLNEEPPSYKEMADKILSADLVYVSGGNSLMMMRKWRFLGVDKLLDKARKNGTILAGVSAGALCWFAYGHSDAMGYYKEGKVGKDWEYIRVKCLGFIDRITFCPHYNEGKRTENFKTMIKKMGSVGIGLENGAALQVDGDRFRILSADKENAKAYKVYKLRARTIEEELSSDKDWQHIGALIRRPVF